jgi:IS5 family transposase
LWENLVPGTGRVWAPERLLCDKAYDSAELRGELEERGTKQIIPNRCNRMQPFSFSKRPHKLRWRIENAFNRLKDFHRHTIRQFSVSLAAALVWWI